MYKKPENLAFERFKKEVKRYKKIDIRTLEMLVLRYAPSNRRFFNQKHKLSYYKFWIKRIEKSGLINPKVGFIGVWDVNSE